MNFNSGTPSSKTGAENFIDHLIKIADDSVFSSNPYTSAGKKMFEDVRAKRQIPFMGNNYRDDSPWTNKKTDISGVNPELTANEQKGDAYQHILAHAAVILYGHGFLGNNRIPVQAEGGGWAHTLHNSGIINPTSLSSQYNLGTFIGNTVSRIAETKDIRKKNFDRDEKNQAEALTEI